MARATEADKKHREVESVSDGAVRLIDDISRVITAAHKSNVEFLRGQIRVGTDLLTGVDDDMRAGRKRAETASDLKEPENRNRRIADAGADTMTDVAERVGDAVSKYAGVLEDCAKIFRAEIKKTTRSSASS